MREMSLAPGTIQTDAGIMPGPESVRCARSAGYSHVGLRVFQGTVDSAHPLQWKSPVWRETRNALSGEGIAPWEIEVILLSPDTVVDDFRAGLEAAAELGGRYVVVGTDDSNTSRLVDKLGALCALAAQFRLDVVVEYIPYSTTRSLTEAAALVDACRASNAGILIDTLHFARAGDSVEAIARLDAKLFPYLQIADAPALSSADLEAVKHQSRNGRLFPGEGALDLLSPINALPTDRLLSIEIINPVRCTALGPLDHARRARESLVSLLSP